jgi:hypothetical protein
MKIDQSVYPDREPPKELITKEDKADYVHRICSAFDFGIVPEVSDLEEFSRWRAIFDEFPIPSSPAYHALRKLYRWPDVEREPYLMDPVYLIQDRLEGREDGCEDKV